MERLDLGDCRSIFFPAISAHCSGLAQLNGDNARGRISAKKQRVFLEFHASPNFVSFRAMCQSGSDREISYCDCAEQKLRDASTSLSITKMKIRFSLLVLMFIPLPALSVFAEQTPQSLADAEVPSLLTIYKDFHTHPELSGHEERSSAIVAKELKAAGCDVTERVGKYDKPGLNCFGVVGVMKNGVGPTVLVRSDLDALPVHEETGLPYASTVTTKNDEGKDVPVMHACGHDAHISMFIGVARVLAKLKDQWHGTIVFVAQPAEETGNGARALLREVGR